MNAPTRKHRRHPLAALVLWLGSSLAACLLALAFAVTAAPAEAQLDSASDAVSQCYPLVVNNLVARAINAAAAVGYPKVDAQVIAGV